MTKVQITEQEFITEAKRLRSAIDNAEIDFLEYLLTCEAHAFWKGSDVSFASYVERQNICQGRRYDRYKKVRDNWSVDDLRRAGIHATMAAALFDSRDLQREVLTEAEKFAEANGTKISKQSAARVAHDIKTRHAVATNGHLSYEALCSENEELRKKLREAEETIMRLKNELKKEKAKHRTVRRSSKSRRATA